MGTRVQRLRSLIRECNPAELTAEKIKQLFMDHDGKNVPGQDICQHRTKVNPGRAAHILGTRTISLAIFDLANRTITVSKGMPCNRRFRTFTFKPNPHYDEANEARKTRIRHNRRRANRSGPYDEELDLENWADRGVDGKIDDDADAEVEEGEYVESDEDDGYMISWGSSVSDDTVVVASDDDSEMDKSVPRIHLWTEEEQTRYALKMSLEGPHQKSRNSAVADANSLEELEKIREKRRQKLERAKNRAERVAQQRAQGHGGGRDEEDKDSPTGVHDTQEDYDQSFDSRNAETFASSDGDAEDLALFVSEQIQLKEQELQAMMDEDEDVLMQTMMMESIQALNHGGEQKASPEMNEPDSAIDVTTSPSIPFPAVPAAAALASGDSA